MKVKGWEILSDRRNEVKDKVDEAIKTALKAVGAQASSRARDEITRVGAIDTGLLRNSITFALAGETPKVTTYHAAFGNNRKKDGTRYTARASKAGSVNIGKPYGKAPDYGYKNNAVYIGTNVFYAPYVEMGTRNSHGGVKMAARPYLKPAVENHQAEYQQILTEALQKVR